MKKAVLESNTFKKVRVMAGVYSSAKIPTLSSTVRFQNDACSYTTSGSTVQGQSTISVCDIASHETLCLKMLQDYFSQEYLPQTSSPENASSVLMDKIIASRISELSREVDELVWTGGLTGTTSGGNARAVCSNGILNKITKSTATTGTTTAMTIANSVDLVDTIYGLAPAAIKGMEDLTLFVSPEEFDNYLICLRNKNYFNFGTDLSNLESIKHPGAPKLTIYRTVGLAGRTEKVLTFASNIVVGTLANDEWMNFDMWYSKDDQDLKTRVAFKLGANVAFSEHTVYLTL